MAASMLARMVIPVVVLGNPLKDFIADDDAESTKSPQFLAQISASHNMCDPQALLAMRRQIRDLASNIHAVQTSFTNMIASLRALDELNIYKRHQYRHVMRELPNVIALSENFKNIVVESREEAASAQVVISSFYNTILKNLHSSSQQALKSEVDAIAKAILRHEVKAQELGAKFSSLSQAIAAVSETIRRCVTKEREKAIISVVNLSLQVRKLSIDVSSCKESRSVFSNSVQGIGQHCIGLLSAAFGYDPLNDETSVGYEVPVSESPAQNLPAPETKLKKAKDQVKVFSDRPYRLVDQEAANLNRDALKVAAMGQLWSALHMELHKISTWLDTKFVEGQMQGSWELYQANVENIKGPTEELISQLDQYAKHAFFQ